MSSATTSAAPVDTSRPFVCPVSASVNTPRTWGPTSPEGPERPTQLA